jgi:hypothetical protein
MPKAPRPVGVIRYDPTKGCLTLDEPKAPTNQKNIFLNKIRKHLKNTPYFQPKENSGLLDVFDVDGFHALQKKYGEASRAVYAPGLSDRQKDQLEKGQEKFKSKVKQRQEAFRRKRQQEAEQLLQAKRKGKEKQKPVKKINVSSMKALKKSLGTDEEASDSEEEMSEDESSEEESSQEY